MPWVEQRDGSVVGVYANRQPGYAEEERPEDHADLVAVRLGAAREARCDEVDALYEAKCLHGFLHLGTRYEMDPVSRGLITGLAADAANCINGMEGAQFVPIPFMSADNVPTLFDTPATLVALGTSLKFALLAMFQRKTVLKLTIRASADPASIDITTGWPA